MSPTFYLKYLETVGDMVNIKTYLNSSEVTGGVDKELRHQLFTVIYEIYSVPLGAW